MPVSEAVKPAIDFHAPGYGKWMGTCARCSAGAHSAKHR